MPSKKIHVREYKVKAHDRLDALSSVRLAASRTRYANTRMPAAYRTIRPLYSNGEILVGKKNLKSENLMSKGIPFQGSERIETSNGESSESFS